VRERRQPLKYVFFLFFFINLSSFSLFAQYDILFSADEDFSINGLQVRDENLIRFSAENWKIDDSLPCDLLPTELNVDAVSKIPDSSIGVVFSLEEDTQTDGTFYADEDIIYYDGENFSLLWDGSEFGLPLEVNLDALHLISLVPLEFLFSLEEDAELPIVGYIADEDIIRFSEDFGFSIEVDGSEIGIPIKAEIDALCVNPETFNMVFSLDSALLLGTDFYDDSDLIEWNGSDFSLFFNSYDEGIPAEVNLDACHILGKTKPVAWMFF